jgi:hypothetical protein
MMDFYPHPTDPNLVILKTTPRYIGKHSDEDLQAAVLAEREACAKLCEKMSQSTWTFCNFAEAIRARTNK